MTGDACKLCRGGVGQARRKQDASPGCHVGCRRVLRAGCRKNCCRRGVERASGLGRHPFITGAPGSNF